MPAENLRRPSSADRRMPDDTLRNPVNPDQIEEHWKAFRGAEFDHELVLKLARVR